MGFAISIMNTTQVEYAYIIYLTLPKTKTCTSVVWTTGIVPANTGTPTPITIPWEKARSIAIGNRTDAKIIQTDLWDVDLHTRWALQYTPESSIYDLIQIPNTGSEIEEDIIVENRTGKELNVGIAVSQLAGLYWENVLSNENVIFMMDITYHLALLLPTQVVEIGDLVDTGGYTETPGAIQPKDILAMAPIHFTGLQYLAIATISTSEPDSPRIQISYPT